MLESPASPAGSASPDAGAGAGSAGANGTPAVPASQPASQGSPTSAPGVASPAPAPAAPETPAAPSGRDGNRDASGRFVKKSQLSPIPELPGVFDSSEEARETDSNPAVAAVAAAAADGSAPPIPAASPGAQPAEGQPAVPAQAEKFKFGGVEFDTREQAEQSFSTLRGQFRSMDNRTKEAVSHANRAVDAAVAWQRYANELEAQAKGAAVAAPGAKPGQPAIPAAEADPGEIDWAFYKQLDEEHGPVIANIWLKEQNDKALESRLSKILDERLSSITPVVEEQQARSRLVNLFTQVQAMVDPTDNSPAYPELNDPAAAQAIMLLLPQLGLTPEQAMTHQGVHLAVAVYRDQVSRAGRRAPATASSPASAPAAAVPASVLPNAAALAAAASAAAAVASGAQPPVMQPASAGGPNGSMLAAIRGAHDLRINEGLGFSFD